MSKITLDVDKKDVNTVLTILNNLKAGLVKNLHVDNKAITNSMQGKKAVKQAILEDEFIAKPTTTSKYLSKAAYREKLNKSSK